MRVVRSQRWRAGRSSFRVPGDALCQPRYDVEVLEHKRAKAFVIEHHYSRSYVAERLAVGLFDGVKLTGVAAFSVPMNQQAITARAGVAPELGVDLGRFVLLDDVPFNAESWFLRRAFAVLKQALGQVQAVIAYSDPIPRKTNTGRLVMPGHVGVIYQAHNGRFVGRSSPRSLYLGPDGRAVAPRALSKLKAGDRGAA